MQKKPLTVLALCALIGSSVCAAKEEGVSSETAPASSESQEIGKAADSAAQAVAGWLDKLSDSVRTIGGKSSEAAAEAQGYAQELKKQWPELKEKFAKTFSEGIQRGDTYKESLAQWANENFSAQKMQQADDWLKNFKDGVEDKVIDPLVPYLLSVRYASPLQEWDAGYRRIYPVRIKGLEQPLELMLPLSWSLTQDLSLGKAQFMSWKNESGNGNLVVALLETPYGATPESLVAGLQKKRPEAPVTKLEGSDISRVTYLAGETPESANAVYYYAIPLEGKTFLLCGEVLRAKDESSESVNRKLSDAADFFNLVSRNLFVRPSAP